MAARTVATLALLGASLPGWASAEEAGKRQAEPAQQAAPAVPRQAPPVSEMQLGPQMPASVPASNSSESVSAPAANAAAPPPGVTLPARSARSLPAPPPEPVRLSTDPRPALSPATFVATMSAAERYRAIADAGGWPTVPNEVTRAKAGDRSAAVATLRQRLAVTGDLPEAEKAAPGFDEGLAAALRRFQARHGLEETGIVGPRTLFHLNVPAATRLRQLQASASRLMGSRFPFGERYVVVNIPSATVEAVDHGTVAHRYVAVVGKPDRASPQVETRITSINFNPTWTVPVSLIRKDIIPHVRKDPAYLAKMKIRLFDAAGTEIDPGTIDWSTERAVNYTIRQDSGVANSLGEVRIDMPNRHAVYMHDTPSKGLFARPMRAQSSGCVRVAGVKDLVGWLLEGTPGPAGPGSGWGKAEIEAAVAGGKRVDVRVARPAPVAWVYMTGYATPDGAVHFRDDLYGLDQAAPPAPAAGLTIDALVTSSIGTLR